MVVAQPYSLGTEMFRIDALGKSLIVKIGDDAAVNTAVQTLQHYLASYRLVSITSEQELHQTLGSAVAIFIVGHGNAKGLGTATHLIVTWSTIKTFLQPYSSAKAYVIACDAKSALNEYNINAFGTFGTIDAEIGALMALVQFTIDFSLYRQLMGLAVTLLTKILTKPISQYLPLGFSKTEFVYWMVMVLSWIVFALSTTWIPPQWTIFQRTAFILWTQKIGILVTLIYFAKGWISLSSFISQMVGFVQTALGTMISVIDGLSPWEYWPNVGLILVIIGIAAATAALIQYKLPAVVGSLAAIGISASIDFFDTNDHVG